MLRIIGRFSSVLKPENHNSQFHAILRLNRKPTVLPSSFLSLKRFYSSGKMSCQNFCGKLTAEQYRVTQEKGTERAFTGKYYDHHEKGTYICVCCRAPLFSSETKYDSGSGWPSFYQTIKEGNAETVKRIPDASHNMVRVEVVCHKCDAHLGHVFNDGPPPTYERFCINSASLDFIGADKK